MEKVTTLSEELWETLTLLQRLQNARANEDYDEVTMAAIEWMKIHGFTAPYFS